MSPAPERDGLVGQGADVIGVVLTAAFIAFSEFLRGEWLLFPALYWTALIGVRLIGVLSRAGSAVPGVDGTR